jgi:hypothetical protein
MAEACAVPFCYTIMTPKDGALVQFPIELSLHDYQVEVKVWSGGVLKEVFGKQCPKAPLCSAIRCLFCLERLVNPQCNAYAFALFLLLALYFGTQVIYVTMKLTWIATSCGKAIRKSTWASIRVVHWMANKCKGYRRVPSQPQAEDQIEQASKPLSKPVKKKHRSPSKYDIWPPASKSGSAGNLQLTSSLAVIIIAAQILSSHACSVMETLRAEKKTCLEDENKTLTCALNSVTRLSLVPKGQVSCLLIEDNLGNPIGSMQISVDAISFACQKTSLYYTRNFEMEVESSKRCANAGSCDGDKCADVERTTKLKEIGNTANDAVGYTYCAETCGCLACGCFFCTSACLFYRTYATAKDDIKYHIFDCPSWLMEVKTKIKIESSHLIRTDNESNTPTSPPLQAGEGALALVPGQPEEWAQVKFNLISATTIPVKLNKKFITDGSRIASVEASARGQPVANTVGAMQCASEDEAASLDCTIPQLCSCTTQENDVKCSCPAADLQKVFNDPEALLPLQTAGYTLKQNGNNVQLEMSATAALELEITMEGKKFASVVERTQCTVRKARISGCYNCLTKAVLKLICKSTFGEAMATARCTTLSFLVNCDSLGQNNSITLDYNSALVDESCDLVCPGGTTAMKFKGTLLYVRQDQYNNFSNIVTTRKSGTGEGANWESIWKTMKEFFTAHLLGTVLAIVGLIIGVIVLILVLPCILQALCCAVSKVRCKYVADDKGGAPDDKED